jgi:hypothetical protein
VELPIRTNELLSIRNASRNLYDAVDRLQRNEASKFVLLNSRNEMQAVLLTPESYAKLAAAQAEIAAQERAA